MSVNVASVSVNNNVNSLKTHLMVGSNAQISKQRLSFWALRFLSCLLLQFSMDLDATRITADLFSNPDQKNSQKNRRPAGKTRFGASLLYVNMLPESSRPEARRSPTPAGACSVRTILSLRPLRPLRHTPWKLKSLPNRTPSRRFQPNRTGSRIKWPVTSSAGSRGETFQIDSSLWLR